MDISSIIYEVQAKPNTYALIVRPTWKELKNLFDSHIKLSGAVRINKVNMTYNYSNGSRIYFGVFAEEHHKEKYRGMQYQFMDTLSIKEEYATFLEGRRT